MTEHIATKAAQEEAEVRYPTAHPDDVADCIRRAAFVAGAEWAADRRWRD